MRKQDFNVITRVLEWMKATWSDAKKRDCNVLIMKVLGSVGISLGLRAVRLQNNHRSIKIPIVRCFALGVSDVDGEYVNCRLEFWESV